MKKWMIMLLLPVMAVAACKEKKKDTRYKGPLIKWVDLTHNDTVTAGDSVILRYKFFNDGWAPGGLERVEPGAGWCKTEWPQEKLKVWDTAEVVLRCLFEQGGYLKDAVHIYHDGDTLSRHTAITYNIVVRDSAGNLPR